MSWTRIRSLLRYPLFVAALLLAAVLREQPNAAVNQAIIWLPTGVAISGVFLLGLRAAWLVAFAAMAQRLVIGYEFGVAIPAAAGSASEALLGAWLLQRLGFRPSMERLRDIGVLLVAAFAAPIGSIFFSYIGRAVLWPDPDMPFYSGWDGWWRMNALGALTAVPIAATWSNVNRRDWSPALAGVVLLGLTVVPIVLVVVMSTVPTGILGVKILTLAFAVLLFYISGRWGVRAATLASATGAITFALATSSGIGPYLQVEYTQRHVAVQLFVLFFITLPPGLAALIAERRAAEARGERSDELRRAIQAALPDITYRLRRDGTVLEASLPPGADPPVPVEQMLGRSITEWLAPDRVDEMRDKILVAFARGETVSLEYEVDVAGRRRMREARCVPHGPDELLAVVRDITDRKWGEGTTAFEAEVLALVAAGRPTGEVFASIVSGMEGLMSGAMCSIVLAEGRHMRVAHGESLPAEFNARVDGLEIGPLIGSCGAAMSTKRTVVVADMTESPLWQPYLSGVLPLGLRACWSVPILDSDGGVLGSFASYYGEVRAPEARELALAERAGALAGIAIERERRAEALRRSQDLLASINRNVKEGLFRATPALELLYSNHAFARMFGWSGPDEMAGASLEDMFADPARRDDLRRTIGESGEWLNEEVLFLRRDGASFWGLLSGTAVRDADGGLSWYDGAIADITERKALELQFRHAQKMEAVGKLAGGVAHDFNNLLTVIFGCAEAIRIEASDTPAIRAQAEQVLDAATRASRLTRQLLAYSRQQVMSPRVIDLVAVVDQMSGMLRRLIGEDYRLTVEHTGGPYWVRVDPSQIEQVVLNLLVNARDAMPEGGAIVLQLDHAKVTDAQARVPDGMRPGSIVRLCVRDEGAGMTPDVQARAFDPFFTTKPPGQGTGLGLSTVYGIVQQSGGVTWIDSAVGHGTSVWVGLPACEAPRAEMPGAQDAPAAGQRGTLLVVEDEAGVRGLVCMTLRRAGYDVIEAGDGEAGLQAAAAHPGPIALVVSDVVMPRLGGREMATRLLALRPGQRILFVSGYPEDARSPQDLAGEAAAFLAKPFTPSELLASVRGALERSSVPNG